MKKTLLDKPAVAPDTHRGLGFETASSEEVERVPRGGTDNLLSVLRSNKRGFIATVSLPRTLLSLRDPDNKLSRPPTIGRRVPHALAAD